MFRDPVFAHDRSRVLALCSELRHLGHATPWECEGRPEHFDNRLLRLLRDVGCDTIKIGLESADPEVLVAIGHVQDELRRQLTWTRLAPCLPSAGRSGWSVVYS